MKLLHGHPEGYPRLEGNPWVKESRGRKGWERSSYRLLLAKRIHLDAPDVVLEFVHPVLNVFGFHCGLAVSTERHLHLVRELFESLILSGDLLGIAEGWIIGRWEDFGRRYFLCQDSSVLGCFHEGASICFGLSKRDFVLRAVDCGTDVF